MGKKSLDKSYKDIARTRRVRGHCGNFIAVGETVGNINRQELLYTNIQKSIDGEVLTGALNKTCSF